MTLVIIFAYIAVSCFEAIQLFKNNQRKEMALYLGMMIISLVVSILLSIGVKIPSLAVFIQKMVAIITE